MAKKAPNLSQNLSQKELKSIILIRLQAEQTSQLALQKKLNEFLGLDPPKSDPSIIKLNDELLSKVAGLMAYRLRRNDQTRPMLSRKDLSRLMPFVRDSLNKIGHPLNAEEWKTVKRLMKIFFEHLLDIRGNDFYGDLRVWIEALCALAIERHVTWNEVLQHEDAIDELTRRTQSREQFLSYCHRMEEKIGIDALKALLPKPKRVTRTRNPAFADEMLNRATKIFEASIKYSKAIIRKLLHEEAVRIYGPE